MSVAACRYDRKCNRANCWFAHPNGRDIDERRQGPTAVTAPSQRYPSMVNDSTQFWYPEARDCPCCGGFVYGCNDPSCRAIGICGCSYMEEGGGESDEERMEELAAVMAKDDTWKDEWYPVVRTCTCCSGYVYRCKCTTKAVYSTLANPASCHCFDPKTKTAKATANGNGTSAAPATEDQ